MISSSDLKGFGMCKTNSITFRSLVNRQMFTLCLAIGLIFTMAASAIQQQSVENRVKLELKDSQPLSGTSTDDIYNVKVYFETDKIQADVSAGLTFIARFVNAASSPVNLLDP